MALSLSAAHKEGRECVSYTFATNPFQCQPIFRTAAAAATLVAEAGAGPADYPGQLCHSLPMGVRSFARECGDVTFFRRNVLVQLANMPEMKASAATLLASACEKYQAAVAINASYQQGFF